MMLSIGAHPFQRLLALRIVHMNPAVGASQTGRVNAAATGVAQQFVRVGIHLLHADALHLNVCRLAVQMLAELLRHSSRFAFQLAVRTHS